MTTQLSQPIVDLKHLQASLAAELAVGLLPVPDILRRFKLTRDQLKLMLKDHQFKQMIVQFKREWHDAANAKERIRLKAALMVEENLLMLDQIFNDLELNPQARLDAFKQMVTLADVAPKADAAQTGPKFNLTLNLGNDSKPVTIDAEAVSE